MCFTLLRWLLAAPSEPNEAPYICWLAADLVVYSCLAAQPEGSDPTLCSRDISLPAVTAAPYPISILCLWSSATITADPFGGRRTTADGYIAI